jgi:hypothetical protein
MTCAGRLFSPGTPVSSTNKTDRHGMTEILLKVALSTITIAPGILIHVAIYIYTVQKQIPLYAINMILRM